MKANGASGVADPLYTYYKSDTDAEVSASAVDSTGHSLAVAEYLGDMIGQLEGMAKLARFDLLVYLLSMARVEAQTQARTLEGRRHTS